MLNKVGENLVFGQDTTEIYILAADHVQQNLGETQAEHVAGSKQEAAAAVVARAAQLLRS